MRPMRHPRSRVSQVRMRCEARVVLEHSYKYSAQHCARDLDQGRDSRPRTLAAARAFAARAPTSRPARRRTARSTGPPTRGPAAHGRSANDRPPPSTATRSNTRSNGNMVLSGNVGHETGRPARSAPITWSTTPQDQQRQARGRRRIHRPRTSSCAATAAPIPRRSAPTSKARSSSCPSATRAAPRAA